MLRNAVDFIEAGSKETCGCFTKWSISGAILADGLFDGSLCQSKEVLLKTSLMYAVCDEDVIQVIAPKSVITRQP